MESKRYDYKKSRKTRQKAVYVMLTDDKMEKLNYLVQYFSTTRTWLLEKLVDDEYQRVISGAYS